MGVESVRVGELRRVLLVQEKNRMSWTEADAVALAAHRQLVLPLADIQPEPSYHSFSLCVLDAVFSIGVRYESVQHVLQHDADHRRIPLLSSDYSPLFEIGAATVAVSQPLYQAVSRLASKLV